MMLGAFFISARVFEGEKWLEDIAKYQQFPTCCSPIAIILRRIA